MICTKYLASTFKIHNDHYTISKEEFKLLRESATKAGFGTVMAMMDLGSFDEWWAWRNKTQRPSSRVSLLF